MDNAIFNKNVLLQMSCIVKKWINVCGLKCVLKGCSYRCWNIKHYQLANACVAHHAASIGISVSCRNVTPRKVMLEELL